MTDQPTPEAAEIAEVRKALAMVDAGYAIILSPHDVAILLREYDKRFPNEKPSRPTPATEPK